MRAHALTVLLSVALAATVAWFVAAPAPRDTAPAPEIIRDDAPVRVAGDFEKARAGLDQLRMRLTLMEERIAQLEARRDVSSREEPAPEPFTDLLVANAGSMTPEGARAVRDEVARVMAQLQEERTAEEREEELEGRAKEAVEAYEEYDKVDGELDGSVAKLGDTLGLDAARRNDLRDLLSLQNERNREMTRLWSSGKVSDEELESIYFENRAAHRSEILALVGREGLPGYRKFLTEGGLGGRFSYFTTPWEEWGDEDEQR